MFFSRFYTPTGRPLAGGAPFSSLGRSVRAHLVFSLISTRLSAVLSLVMRLFPLMVPRTALLQHLPTFLLAYRASFGWLSAFFHFWSLGQRSFSVSPRFYALIGRRLAGCMLFSSFGRSVSARLAAPFISAHLSASHGLLCTFFLLGRSVSAPLAFPRVSTRLSAVLWLVARLLPLLVAQSALL